MTNGINKILWDALVQQRLNMKNVIRVFCSCKESIISHLEFDGARFILYLLSLILLMCFYFRAVGHTMQKYERDMIFSGNRHHAKRLDFHEAIRKTAPNIAAIGTVVTAEDMADPPKRHKAKYGKRLFVQSGGKELGEIVEMSITTLGAMSIQLRRHNQPEKLRWIGWLDDYPKLVALNKELNSASVDMDLAQIRHSDMQKLVSPIRYFRFFCSMWLVGLLFCFLRRHIAPKDRRPFVVGILGVWTALVAALLIPAFYSSPNELKQEVLCFVILCVGAIFMLKRGAKSAFMGRAIQIMRVSWLFAFAPYFLVATILIAHLLNAVHLYNTVRSGWEDNIYIIWMAYGVIATIMVPTRIRRLEREV